MKKLFIRIAVTVAVVLLLNVILCLGLGWYPGIFQGQPCLYVNNGESVLQRCADSSWEWFSDPEMRWTDGSLYLITGEEY